MKSSCGEKNETKIWDTKKLEGFLCFSESQADGVEGTSRREERDGRIQEWFDQKGEGTSAQGTEQTSFRSEYNLLYIRMFNHKQYL